MDRKIFMGKGWLGALLSLILCFALVFSVAPPMAAEEAEEGCDCCPAYPIMRPDMETLWEWIEAYNNAPRAEIEREGFEAAAFGASKDLLSHLDYDAATRNQGNCGDCWAWAGTGCLGIALNVQEGTKDRLSVQYLNSNYNGGSGSDWACCGGWLGNFANFYDPPGGTGMCIPWDNPNADFQDAGRCCPGDPCGNYSTAVDASTISTDPNYPITSIEAQVVDTHSGEGVPNQAAAINNIKTMLNQNKAVWFGFRLPDDPAWNSFFSFWDNNGESVIYNMDQFCGDSWVSGQGGGHAVLCVGYNDDNPANEYWIMLNSWGTAGGNRPNGLFRIDMDMNYDCSYPNGGSIPAFEWWILDVLFWSVPDITVSPTSFEKTLPPDTTHDYMLTISNDGDADLTYDIADYETTGFTAPAGVEALELPGREPLELIELSPAEPVSFGPPPLRGAAEELAYDDNVADTAYAWLGVGGMFAVRFTPPSYPVALETARICLWPYGWPDSDHEQFGVRVYDDNGSGGAPGTQLGTTVYTTATDWGWWDVDISGLGITITEGDFYIAYEQLTDSGGDCEGLCADESDPDGRSWSWDGASWLTVEDKGFGELDWMIRCVVEKPDCGWLSESPTSGSVAPGNSDPITVSINTTGLAAGNYSVEIVIANNDPDENPKTVPVTLHVSAGGLMEGDTTLDGHVTIIDALLIAQHLVHYRTLEADQLICADTFGDDGNVDIMDAFYIARWIVDPTTPLWDPVKDVDMLPPVP